MTVNRGRRNTAARRALQKALLDEIGFENILDRVARLPDGSGQIVDTDRPAAKFIDDGKEQL